MFVRSVSPGEKLKGWIWCYDFYIFCVRVDSRCGGPSQNRVCILTVYRNLTHVVGYVRIAGLYFVLRLVNGTQAETVDWYSGRQKGHSLGMPAERPLIGIRPVASR